MTPSTSTTAPVLDLDRAPVLLSSGSALFSPNSATFTQGRVFSEEVRQIGLSGDSGPGAKSPLSGAPAQIIPLFALFGIPLTDRTERLFALFGHRYGH